MTKKHTTPEAQNAWIISANDLLLGDLVYLGAKQVWTAALADAVRLKDRDAAEQAVQDAQSRVDEVIDPVLVPVLIHTSGAVELTRIRDRFRESGPTHRTDLPRQSIYRTAEVLEARA